MDHMIIPVNETAINETFEPINNSFEVFQEFSSDLFFQIINWVAPMVENLVTSWFSKITPRC